jgi:iron complex transport system substrate-binding protein
MRVVSLLPSATEIVGALGALEHLVGVTHECDWPPVVNSRARVTTCAVDSTASPAAIDAQVRDLAHTGTPLYGIKERMLHDLHPDVIITQSLCEVCAVHEGDVRALAASITPAPQIVTLGATTLEEVFADITRVATALQLTDESEELLDGLRDRLRRVHATLKAAQAPRPRVAVVEWGDPIFTGGHWVPEMIAKAGGIDVIGTAGAVSKTITLAQLQASAPDLLVIGPCGYNLPRAIDEGRRLLALDDWAWAREIPVWAIDANSYASRPGPRLVEGTEILARLFNPSLFTPLDPVHAARIN